MAADAKETFASVSPARANTAILLAYVLEHADMRAGELAEYAGRARIKGLQCENTYKGFEGQWNENVR
ncbi:DUF2514 family protein [unidentified bacterial endosymbiont]|uniref:DUF2514 family protein n=1 Tax=unidentified bacterial endosymbiont TaxID=2355 RepID=UPI0020A19267|nr:DUF2514 family protein [unidentified bacterial endosymbiont]